jgi:hypothetical protein
MDLTTLSALKYEVLQNNCNFLENGYNNFDLISIIYGDRLSIYKYIDGIFREKTRMLLNEKACVIS